MTFIWRQPHLTLNALAALFVGVFLFASTSKAAAESSSMYAPFTQCPTGAPAMNEPANELAGCIAGSVPSGSMKLGTFGGSFTSPIHFQLAVIGGNEELHVVPASTSFEFPQFFVPNPFYVPPPGESSSEIPNSGSTHPRRCKKKHHHKHRRHGHKKSTQGKHRGKRRLCGRARASLNSPSQMSASAEGMIQITTELAGDIRDLDIWAVLGEPGTAFELPLKLHLQGANLGSDCYIGSNDEPIVVVFKGVSTPSNLVIQGDPNGFNVGVIELEGINLEGTLLSTPGATGCGVDGQSLDALIESAIGLAASEASSKIMLENGSIELVATEYDGTPPDGGAELQAAFEAAQ
jgi:hypothetical protein